MIEQMHLDQFIVKKATKSNSYVSQYPAGKFLKIVEHILGPTFQHVHIHKHFYLEILYIRLKSSRI